mmetsp:Transcript_4710/g.8152  ORF Transcript_4710/g.8152 Transcript_4710/m.8152 type:complete len:461 (-) Transcript_4710:1343-2725(-)
MSFFTRLFKHPVDKARVSSGNSAPIPLGRWNRAATAENRTAEESSDDEDVMGDGAMSMPGPLRRPGGEKQSRLSEHGKQDEGVMRRMGGELRRSRTAGDNPPVRQNCHDDRVSMGSSTGAGSFDDCLRQAYGKIKQCHRGRNATILEAVDRLTRRPVVVKAYSKLNLTTIRQDKMNHELEVLQSAAACQGIVKILAHIDDKTHLYLVLEAIPGHTLIELMANNGGRIAESRCVIEVVYPLLQALAALHGLGVVHRDIKPEHIMCSLGSIKLVDFCESATQHHHRLNHRVGQLEYMAPEVLNKPSADEMFHMVLCGGLSESELPQYDEKADIWSAGVVIYEALTGQQPFMAERPPELVEMHERMNNQCSPDGTPMLLNHPFLSPLAKQFLLVALQPDSALRPSAEELLGHPWIAKHLHSLQSQWLLASPNRSQGNSPALSLDLATKHGMGNHLVRGHNSFR